ncbi:hypothetical protein BGZ95_011571 [Linnemannia exigua]|uniref:F-box domain-containing protein n=1 Tax=Linnemannia exigua TaxID=604196 RepID=A0AAD4D9P3_9FUNG|nr:hypothetical protein BGZ95_011571 [Linnemannia exigua]
MTHPLDIPEIIARIGEFIPLWQQDAYSHFHFRPKALLDATAVSKSFRQALLPVLWYTCDMSPLESNLPFEVLVRYSYHFRILYQTLPLAPSALPCTRLLDLTISGCDPETRQLVRNNTHLRRLHWSGPTAYCLDDIPLLERDMVEGLTALEDLHLSEWDLGQKRALIPLLMSVRCTLRTLTLDTVSGGGGDNSTNHSGTPQQLPSSFRDNIFSTDTSFPLLRLRELTLHLQYTQSTFLLNLVCLCPELEKLALVAACDINVGILSENLRKHCPRLHTLKVDGLYFGLFDTYRILSDHHLAALILSTLRDEDCNQRRQMWKKTNGMRQWEDDKEEVRLHQGLAHFTADIHGFEPLFTEALMQCGNTLRSLRLSIRHDHSDLDNNINNNGDNNNGFSTTSQRTDLVRDQAQLNRILKACPHLERVTLLYEDTILPDPTLFGVKHAGLASQGQEGPVVTVNVTESEFVPLLH